MFVLAESERESGVAATPYPIGSMSSLSPRWKKKVEEESTEVTEVPPPPVFKELRRRWSHFIQKVYETDPLVCPKCSGEMRIISLIDHAEVIIHPKHN